jgi:pimeloyl-ACP methyl ester carboxylesterase
MSWILGLLLILGASSQAPTAADPLPPLTLPSVPSRFAELNGSKVHYKSFGAGSQALVFVHGWSCDMTFWYRQVRAFSGRARVILIDLPGHGLSDAPKVTYGAALFGAAIDAVLQAEGIGKAVLVGHSMGVPAVRQFDRAHPEKTLAIVAVDGSLRAVVSSPLVMTELAARYRQDDYKAAVETAVDSMFSEGAPADLKGAVKARMVATPQHVIVSAMEEMGDPAIWTPDPIHAPLLVVLAKNPLWTQDYEAFVRRIAPQVEYHVWEGVGHFLMMERPEEFNSLLSTFLARHRLLLR